MADVVIEVRGGTVVDVYTDIQGARFILVDWDLREDQKGSVGCEYPTSSLDDLPRDTQQEYKHSAAYQ